MKKSIIGLLAALGLFAVTSAQAIPAVTTIFFDNNTDLALDAKIAGKPGKSIPARVTSYGVPYIAVYVTCQYTGKTKACPIEFFDQKNQALVATVIINADEISVSTPPVLHGEYSNTYTVTGWETTPATHIRVNTK
jgi:hypothetical protein